MIVDGRSIAEDIQLSLKELVAKQKKKLSLAVFVMTDDFATRTFITIKERVAREIGIHVAVFDISPTLDTEALIEKIKEAAEKYQGIVVQFPLPQHIDRDRVRNAIPRSHDVDVISDGALKAFQEGSRIFPPVVGAIDEILTRNNVALENKRVVVVGEGRLVGKPAALYARREDAEVHVVNAESGNSLQEIKKADVLILGAGVPGLLKSDMVKEGVMIFDAGTSEARGKLAGDADPACAHRAALFTPVPGGIGPITVAMLFKNLLALLKES